MKVLITYSDGKQQIVNCDKIEQARHVISINDSLGNRAEIVKE